MIIRQKREIVMHSRKLHYSDIVNKVYHLYEFLNKIFFQVMNFFLGPVSSVGSHNTEVRHPTGLSVSKLITQLNIMVWCVVLVSLIIVVWCVVLIKNQGYIFSKIYFPLGNFYYIIGKYIPLPGEHLLFILFV